MANNWNIIEFDVEDRGQNGREYSIYSNGSDFIKASITRWNGKSAEEITITESFSRRKFIHANYCKMLDRIEIHFIENKDFRPTPLTIENNSDCIVNCTKIVFVYYTSSDLDQNGNVRQLIKCKKVDVTQPGHKKGSIIVGNP